MIFQQINPSKILEYFSVYQNKKPHATECNFHYVHMYATEYLYLHVFMHNYT